ncbi:MFS transporter [Clostridium saccharoperbutylacetonicum]|uniref:MFS transporter n=1 Tax=Clostridium saccharoperbutylacetonicum TaxID=36745 RepID=UPI0009838CD1|nr:MFS transporter [Clostridium saccharoperbutylacetonicum]AQR98089.1 enterobactin exporter EntS [Clostridium saccharoperbutylacetonicum]NSB33982.1 MFS family permease [Clostridium saccharoperbutylacetonicum]
MNKLIHLLRNNLFRAFFFSNIIAYIGINIGLVGINWFIVDYTNKNQILATYTSISLITTVVTSFFIGTIVDKYNKSIIMKCCNIIQSIFLGIFFILLLNKINIEFLIYFIAVINSICLTIYNTASRGVIHDIIDIEDLIYGNSVIEMCIQSGAIVASFITGVVYKDFGFNLVLLIMIISLLLGAILMKKVEGKGTKKSTIDTSYLNQLKVGVKYLTKNSRVLFLGIIIFIPNIVTLMSNNVLPGYVKNCLKKSAVTFGVADMLFGVGAFIAGLIVVEMSKKYKRDLIEIYMFILSIVSLISLFIFKNEVFLYILYFTFGLGNSSLKVTLNTYLMEIVPQNLYGRCLAFWNSISSIIQSVLVMVLGILIDNTNVCNGYLFLSLIMFIGLISVNCGFKKSNKK